MLGLSSIGSIMVSLLFRSSAEKLWQPQDGKHRWYREQKEVHHREHQLDFYAGTDASKKCALIRRVRIEEHWNFRAYFKARTAKTNPPGVREFDTL